MELTFGTLFWLFVPMSLLILLAMATYFTERREK